MKKLISGILAVLMVASVSVTAFADTQETTIYQQGDKQAVLSNYISKNTVKLSLNGTPGHQSEPETTTTEVYTVPTSAVCSIVGPYWEDLDNGTFGGYVKQSDGTYKMDGQSNISDISSPDSTGEPRIIASFDDGYWDLIRIQFPSEGNSKPAAVYFSVQGDKKAQPSSPSTPSTPATPTSSTSSTYKSDTGLKLSLGTNASYQFKITSLNGKKPTFVVPGKSFKVSSAGNKGKDYFFNVKAIGKDGDSAGVYINGEKTPHTVLSINNAVKIDTGKKLTVKAGNTYQFKITANTKPTFASGTSSAFKVSYTGHQGNDYFFKVKAVGKTGQGAGFYLNGSKTPVTVGTIG